jgi:renalase
MPNVNSRSSVAIVGAGPAGLAARTYLAESTVKVDCFDKGRGPGGRMSRRRAGDYQFDHGAQYFTARSREFSDAVARWIADGSVQRWQPRIGVLKGGLWTQKASATVWYVGVPGMNQPAKILASIGEAAGASPLRLETRIVALQRERDGQWSLIDEGSGRYGPYHAVILAIPPAQALELVSSSTGGAAPGRVGVDEAPGLDRVRKILDATTMDPCWALMVVFEPKLRLDWDAAFVHGGPLTWIARNSSKPGRSAPDTWVVHAGSQWSRRHLDDEADEVASRLIEEFCSAAGLGTTGPGAARPVWSTAHRWRYARPDRDGGAPRAAGAGTGGIVANREEPFLWDGTSGIGVCGDWLSGGRVEGAYLSGRSLAGHLAAVIP